MISRLYLLSSPMPSPASTSIPPVSTQSRTQENLELSEFSMPKSWWSEVVHQAVILPPPWLVKASTSSSSNFQSFLGRVICPLQFTRLYTPFCRYHIGESLIPSVRHYLKFIGAEEKVANYGFKIKVSVHHECSARDSHLEARSCSKVESAQEGRM